MPVISILSIIGFSIKSINSDQKESENSLVNKSPYKKTIKPGLVTPEAEEKKSFVNNDSTHFINHFNNEEVVFLESDITRVFELSKNLSAHGLNITEVDSFKKLEEKLIISKPFGLIISLKDVDCDFEKLNSLIEKQSVPTIIIAPIDESKRNFSKQVAWLNESVKTSSIINALT